MRHIPPTLCRRCSRLAATWLLLLSCLAVSTARAQAPDPVVAQRGATTLTASGVRELLASLDPEPRQKLLADPQAMANFVRDRMLQRALLDEAHARQWDQRPEIVTRAQLARDTAVTDSYLASVARPDDSFPAEQDVAAAYEANKAKLVVARHYHLAQIFLPVPDAAAKPADDAAKARLVALRSEFAKPGADPVAIARKGSSDKLPVAGADLGWVREDQMLPAIRTIVSGMAEGAISDPVRLPDGWHVVRLVATRPAGPAPLADVHDGLVRALRQARQQQNARAYLDGLLQHDPVQLNEIELGKLAGK